MRILVTGTRDWTDTRHVAGLLGEIDAHAQEPVTLLHGGQGGMVYGPHGWHARGLDFIAAQEAERYGWVLEPHPADWEGPCRPTCRPGHRKRRRDGTWVCPAAGPYRNQEMADSGADVCLAWPGGTGTADMVRRARAAGIPVVRVGPGWPFSWPLALAGPGAASGGGQASAFRDSS